MKNKYQFPEGFSPLQSIKGSFQLVKDPINTLNRRMEKFSGTYKGFLPGKGRVIITQDYNLINYVFRENHTNYKKARLGNAVISKQVGTSLLFINGDDWKRQRRMIQPAFHHASIHQLYETVMSTVNSFIGNLPEGKQVDIFPLMRELSFSVLISSLFNIDMGNQTRDELGRAFVNFADFLSKEMIQPYRKVFYPITGKERKLAKQFDSVREMLKSIVAKRRLDNTPQHDLLDMLLNARYEDTGETMSEEQLISELLLLLFAGHETTGTTMSWLLYLIASNKQVYEKLKQTITSIDMLDAARNSYINAVINEGLRLYPSVWISERVAIKDDEFGPYSYPAGTSIFTYIYGMHRNPNHWEDGSAFNPERFLTPEGTIDKNIKNYLPFGAGPRMCVGNNFAMAEIAFTLYTVFKSFNISTTGAKPVEWPLLTMRPHEVLLDIERI